nr:BamA/TamA family outer membrane protein [Jannaschia sp. Os4]
MLIGGPAAAQQLVLDLPVDEDLSDRLRAVSLLREVLEEPDPADPPTRRDVVAAAQADYARLVTALFEEGHFAPVVSISVDGTEAAALPVVGRRDPVRRVVVSVQAGPRFLFGRARIGPLADDTEIPEAFAPGQPAGTGPIRDAARAAVTRWREEGRAKAAVGGQEIVADHAAARLDATVEIEPGPVVVYGPKTFRGSERVRTEQIRRITDLREGSTFDPEEVRLAARRLQRTGAFASVAIVEGERLVDGNRLPLDITVVEDPPRRFGIGAEVSSSEGLTLSGFHLWRNLTGYADSLRIEAEAKGLGGSTGGEDFGLSFAYNRPATFNRETDLVVTGAVRSIDQEDFESEQIELQALARRIVNDETTFSYGVGYRRSEVTDAFGSRTFNIFSLPLAGTYDRRDEALNPADGYYIETTIRPFVGTETTGGGLRFTADARGYQGFGPGRRSVLAVRFQLGTVVGPDLEDTPPEDLFFSGGGGTVRGQGFQSLAIDQGGGERSGGQSFFGMSTELRQGVTENIGIVGFVDAGWLSAESDWSDPVNHVGAGIGVRYNTGIGPIRFDVGAPVSGPDDGGVRVYIGIGQAF